MVAPDGDIVVAGETNSIDFPLENPIDTQSENTDLFVARLDPNSGAIRFITYLGGSQAEHLGDIALDSEGNIVIVGQTRSDDFPLVNAFQSARAGLFDAFVTKLDASGSELVFSTFFGSARRDFATHLAVGPDGAITVGGHTFAMDDFPSVGGVQALGFDNRDGFLARFSADGVELSFSTLIGGSDVDEMRGLVLDSEQNVYFALETASSDLPLVNPSQNVFGGGRDAYIGRLAADGNLLQFATYYGGSRRDLTRDLVLVDDSSVFVVGQTRSNDLFLLNPLQTDRAGNDLFFAKFSNDSLSFATLWGGSGNDMPQAATLDASKRLIIVGDSNGDFPAVDSLPGVPAGEDAFVVSFDTTTELVDFSSVLPNSGAQSARAVDVNDEGNIVIAGTTDDANIERGQPLPTSGFLEDAFSH